MDGSEWTVSHSKGKTTFSRLGVSIGLKAVNKINPALA
jgi:hypothetical protein